MNSPTGIGTISSQADVRRRLEELGQQHRDLDEVIARLQETSPFNQLQMQRLKQRKLGLKDQMAQLESLLLADIIAWPNAKVCDRRRHGPYTELGPLAYCFTTYHSPSAPSPVTSPGALSFT